MLKDDGGRGERGGGWSLACPFFAFDTYCSYFNNHKNHEAFVWCFFHLQL